MVFSSQDDGSGICPKLVRRTLGVVREKSGRAKPGRPSAPELAPSAGELAARFADVDVAFGQARHNAAGTAR